ncbi:MAG: alkylation response protein AidB-like acyl-CoA dehydrogenase [Saprospiraceae bacterium]|jgi:alkylation response protein AidB-like acyl-CoA dehydrogenase
MSADPFKKLKVAEALKKLKVLAKDNFAGRSAHYDETASFPEKDFKELFKEGLLGAMVPEAYNGLGLGHHDGDIGSLWKMTKEIAKANMALARCWEGHANSMVLLNYIASSEQKKRWFKGVIEEGEIWSAWSGEPLAVAPHENQKFGTRLSKVEGGYLLNGSKVFCSSAPGADWAILLVNTAGEGGARHSGDASATVLMIACKLADPTVSFDDSWWQPIGMKASVSYHVKFDNTFLPDENVIGNPGQYLSEDWQTRFTPHYAATFLGGAEAAFEHTLNYIKKQKKEQDPYIQHRIAKMSMNIDTANLWLQKVAGLWESAKDEEAKVAGNAARYLIEQLATDTVNHAMHACGARSMIRPSPLERIYRDLSFYTRHDNDDQVLSMVGRAILGIDHDKSFFNPKEIKNTNVKINGEEPQKTL